MSSSEVLGFEVLADGLFNEHGDVAPLSFRWGAELVLHAAG
jgi:hypothetical protein